MTAGFESPARGRHRPSWGSNSRLSLPGLSEPTVLPFAREPGISPGRTAVEPREPGTGPGGSLSRASVSVLLASRAEGSDPEESDFEALVGAMLLGVTVGVIIIGLITFGTWALGLAKYTRAW